MTLSTINTKDTVHNHHYATSEGITELEVHVKKSRFIAYLKHVQSYQEAQNFVRIEVQQKRHPKARHVCYAWRGLGGGLGGDCDNQNNAIVAEKYDDDGEPSGTAGQPILHLLQQFDASSADRTTDGGGATIVPHQQEIPASANVERGLVNLVCVVVRYYGGIQLGTGGLYRAYSTAAKQLLYWRNFSSSGDKATSLPTSTSSSSSWPLQARAPQYEVMIPQTQISLSSIPPKNIGATYE